MSLGYVTQGGPGSGGVLMRHGLVPGGACRVLSGRFHLEGSERRVCYARLSVLLKARLVGHQQTKNKPCPLALVLPLVSPYSLHVFIVPRSLLCSAFTHAHTQTHTHRNEHTHRNAHAQTLSLSLSHTHTLTHRNAHTHRNARTHTHT